MFVQRLIYIFLTSNCYLTELLFLETSQELLIFMIQTFLSQVWGKKPNPKSQYMRQLLIKPISSHYLQPLQKHKLDQKICCHNQCQSFNHNTSLTAVLRDFVLTCKAPLTLITALFKNVVCFASKYFCNTMYSLIQS